MNENDIIRIAYDLIEELALYFYENTDDEQSGSRTTDIGYIVGVTLMKRKLIKELKKKSESSEAEADSVGQLMNEQKNGAQRRSGNGINQQAAHR